MSDLIRENRWYQEKSRSSFSPELFMNVLFSPQNTRNAQKFLDIFFRVFRVFRGQFPGGFCTV